MFSLITCLMISCNSETKTEPELLRDNSGRIKLVEQVQFDGGAYQIIDVDGVEYIVRYAGGICPLVTDNDDLVIENQMLKEEIKILKEQLN